MNFLLQRVNGEEMVNLARTGFASHQNQLRKEFQNEQLKQSGESSTASALVSLQKPELMPKVNEPKSFVPKSENSLSNYSRSETLSANAVHLNSMPRSGENHPRSF
ncbi:hypothetical protein NPIL_700641 [Nephila pilipes]|uniref:Uncharacterized protein n=1 Tax=Nephila pilipes TaxID=299642 RepID=A0A8X6T8V6_NEPPI|nr:hypothetical protein NPIL_700641 [Nephila pilipes]